MAFYTDEEEVWKCSKHPSKRRRSGVCPVCLRERLGSLCPDCANVKPCGCCATTSSSSSSSVDGAAGLGSVGRLSNLIESEPAFRRSRSVAIPFLRSRSRFVGGDKISDLGDRSELPPSSAGSRGKASSFWSVFRSSQRSRREEPRCHDVDSVKKIELEEDTAALRKTMMMRSRSVAVPVRSVDSGAGEVKSSKGRSWYFPSPIKVFRQSKISKIVQANSPLYRG
ncbi:uncharacterized protein LOC133777866 [Humulus lupulus]|uniref:uncharacterized protein LOC133777866 n=1 Tax=Humulus lupulus TaxID=3486 RepID=UPI002B40873C|nr:uncharacterized protein LOC133777866 [Humulus lupulus]